MKAKLKNMKKAIDQLHFHSKWFEYNLLPPSFFEQQLERYRHSHEEDNLVWQSLEHHRYLAFQTILSSREGLSDEQVGQYVELCQLDEDETMARSTLIDLLSWQGLTEEQYCRLTEHLAFSNPVVQKIIWRNRMYLELQEDSIPDEIFNEIRQRQDPVFERELVSCDSISREQLEALADAGISRAVRNMAKNRLGRRK